MNIISTTATANIRQNKSRNMLIAIAIILTSILLTTVPIVGLGGYLPRMAAANKVLPTYHTMYRSVSQNALDKMKQNDGFEDVGSRIDLGEIISDDATIFLMAYDANGERLNKISLLEGNTPKNKDEIVISDGLLKVMGLSGSIGDKITIPYQVYEADGLGLQQEKEFTICGRIRDGENNTKNIYGAIVSQDFVKECIKSDNREYRSYVRIADSKKMTTDAIQKAAEELGNDYDVKEGNIVHNGEYLIANYVDPAVYSAIVVIMVIIILSAIMTIYSIYYVSMMNKIQEYGKLKAMGATKKQIKGIVFREGFFVACIAIPIGVILGCLLGYAIIYFMMSSMNADDILSKTVVEVIRNREVQIIQPWVVATALIISFATVYFSLKKPMKIASKISAIEAIRCHSTQREKKKSRKGNQEINLLKLTVSNLSRNKKRSIITILTLGIISVLFMTIATVLSCMQPEDRAIQDVRGDYSLSINFDMGNKMKPEKELNILQMNNPLNDTFKKQLESMNGVTSIEEKLKVYAEVEGLSDSDQPYIADIAGLQEKNIEEISKLLLDGNIDNQKLQDGTGVIMSDGYMVNNMDIQIGDSFTVLLRDGNAIVPHTFTIMAITEAPRSTYGNSDFIMPAETLQQLCQTDLTSELDIYVSKQQKNKFGEALKNITGQNDLLRYDSYEEALAEAQQGIDLMVSMCYAFLVVLGIVGMLNLVNTMINSVYVRKKELGILQAIGLSDKQMIWMLQMEGLFYTAGTLLLGLGLGNIFGYMCFLYAKEAHMMDINTYHYPVIPTIVLILAILGVQLLVTYVINKHFKKESLIDRVRFSE